MTTAPSTWTLVLVPSPTGRRSAALSERVATRAGLLLLAWAERRRDSIRRSVSLARVARPTAAPRPFC